MLKEKMVPERHRVVADNKIVYDGYDSREVFAAFLRAGKHGARRIYHYVDGVPVAFSKAV